MLPAVVREAISEDLSELPDASFAPVGEETLDQLADLPPILTGRRMSRAPSLGPLTSPRKAGRALSLGPLTSPRKASRPPSRRTSRAPSVQPSGVVSTPKVASRAGSRAPSLPPNGGLEPSSAYNGRPASRRSSRAPSLGPVAPASPVGQMVEEVRESVLVREEITQKITTEVVESTGPGATFSVPDEGDTSLFGTDFDDQFQDGQMHGELYPDLTGHHDDSFGL